MAIKCGVNHEINREGSMPRYLIVDLFRGINYNWHCNVVDRSHQMITTHWNILIKTDADRCRVQTGSYILPQPLLINTEPFNAMGLIVLKSMLSFHPKNPSMVQAILNFLYNTANMAKVIIIKLF